MLELKSVTLDLGTEEAPHPLLHKVRLKFPRGRFEAVVGPSGCGKSTLLKLIAGILEPTSGKILWDGRDLIEDQDLEPSELGYVPQFSITHERLTVRESIESALTLKVAGLRGEAKRERAEAIARSVGLETILDRRNSVLSGGQHRRLALALELVSDPDLLLCDEVTSGLDPKAEDEIVHLMHDLSRQNHRTVISVTHSLRHLALYDSVTVLYAGIVAYQGRGDYLLGYFHVDHPEAIFPRLASKEPAFWYEKWKTREHD